MPRLVFGAVTFICLVLLVSPGGQHSLAFAQDAEDYLKAMPKTQREFVEQWLKLSKQRQEATRLKNAVARQDALKEWKKAVNTWLEDANKTLATEGAKDWIGNAVVTKQAVVIENRMRLGTGGRYSSVKVSIPVAGPRRTPKRQSATWMYSSEIRKRRPTRSLKSTRFSARRKSKFPYSLEEAHATFFCIFLLRPARWMLVQTG